MFSSLHKNFVYKMWQFNKTLKILIIIPSTIAIMRSRHTGFYLAGYYNIISFSC